MQENRYLRRLNKLSWTINRWIQIYKATRPNHLSDANRDLDFVNEEVLQCKSDPFTEHRYTRNQLLEFNKLYNQYKLSDEYSSPTAYASEYSWCSYSEVR